MTTVAIPNARMNPFLSDVSPDVGTLLSGRPRLPD
jgi:hypothetical protein